MDAGRAKVSYLSEFPAKGRATGGVRAHTFLKGEDTLALAWAGPGPALAVAARRRGARASGCRRRSGMPPARAGRGHRVDRASLAVAAD